MQKRRPKDVSAEDWEAVDSPELSDEMLANLEPARPPGRPKSAAPKRQVTLRLDPDVIEGYKATGEGWQTRINAALREALTRRSRSSQRAANRRHSAR